MPTRWEAFELYGYDLATKNMQPIWVEVKNDTAQPYWLLPSGLDPHYFSVAEATYAFRASASPACIARNAENKASPEIGRPLYLTIR